MLGFAILVHAQKRIGAAGLVLVLLASGFGQTGEGQKQAIAAALQNRQFGQALQLLRAALHQRPADPELWTMQGGTYLGQMKQKEALLSYNKALKISPDYLPALKGAAQIEYDSGSSRAIPLIQHVLRLRPEDRIAHAMLAVLEYRRGDCAAAVAHFERAGSLLDSLSDGQWNLAAEGKGPHRFDLEVGLRGPDGTIASLRRFAAPMIIVFALSVCFALIATGLGYFVSWHWALPTGASMVVVAGLFLAPGIVNLLRGR